MFRPTEEFYFNNDVILICAAVSYRWTIIHRMELHHFKFTVNLTP